MPKQKLGKNKVYFLSLARLEPTTHQLPSQMHNQFNKFILVIIPTILGFYYHVYHSSISST